MVLALVISMGFSSIPVNAMGTTNEQTIEVDGVAYYISTCEQDGKTIVEIKTSKNDDYYTYKVDVQNQIIEYQTHSLQSEGIYETVTKIIDTSSYAEENEGNFSQISTYSIGYGSKVKCKMGDYWYQTGSEGARTYLKIGCKATYLIRTDNLSDAKNSKCESYKSNIRKCNSSYNKALTAVGGSSAVLGTILALVAANVAFPPSVIVTAVIAVFGSGGGYVAAANYAIDAQEYKDTVADLYITIRTYGTKQ